jgi:hypothetical protein
MGEQYVLKEKFRFHIIVYNVWSAIRHSLQQLHAVYSSIVVYSNALLVY